MYAINSLRFILLVDGHCRFLMVDACFRRSLTECLADCLPVKLLGPDFGWTGAFFEEYTRKAVVVQKPNGRAANAPPVHEPVHGIVASSGRESFIVLIRNEQAERH